MTEKDFIYLNVNSLLDHYENPSENWVKITSDWTSIVVKFLKSNKLLNAHASAWNSPLHQTMIKFSDLTETGQKFIMSQQIEKWLAAWDKQRNNCPSTYIEPDIFKLERRYTKFLEHGF